MAADCSGNAPTGLRIPGYATGVMTGLMGRMGGAMGDTNGRKVANERNPNGMGGGMAA